MAAGGGAGDTKTGVHAGNMHSHARPRTTTTSHHPTPANNTTKQDTKAEMENGVGKARGRQKEQKGREGRMKR